MAGSTHDRESDMTTTTAPRPIGVTAQGDIPRTLDAALDPRWLERVLADAFDGRRVIAVEQVELIRTVATKVRFTVTFEGLAEPVALCLKGLLDVDAATARGGPVTVLEGDFYEKLAPSIDVRVPDCIAAVVDRDAQQGIIVMRDLIADGARFCSALEAFSVDQAAASIEQIARLHAKGDLLGGRPWIERRIAKLAEAQYVTQPMLQEMLDGPRGTILRPEIRDAGRLIAGMRALSARDAERPQTLVHGDAHAGNIYRTADGCPGLIDWQLLQSGGWALDIAYHVAAVLDIAVAEREERRLLDHYLEVMRGLGATVPDRETAWSQYRESPVYGYYLWGITRRVDPAIIAIFVPRLGSAVTRHDSFGLLGV
jgi:hypothetical protein